MNAFQLINNMVSVKTCQGSDFSDIQPTSCHTYKPSGTPPATQPSCMVQEELPHRLSGSMNAFQLINASLDLSAMFDRRHDVVRRHTRFTCRAPADVLLQRFADVIQRLQGSSRVSGNRCVCMPDQGSSRNLTSGPEVIRVGQWRAFELAAACLHGWFGFMLFSTRPGAIAARTCCRALPILNPKPCPLFLWTRLHVMKRTCMRCRDLLVGGHRQFPSHSACWCSRLAVDGRILVVCHHTLLPGSTCILSLHNCSSHTGPRTKPHPR